MSEVVVQLPNQELTKLNIQFLMVAKNQLRVDPLAARHQLGMDDKTAEFLESLSAQDVLKLGESGVSAVQFRFQKDSLSHLQNYIKGDDLAIAQAVLGQGS